MAEHRITVERQGRSVEVWEPGDEPSGIHNRVAVEREEFPEEWELVEAKCSCGLVFTSDESALMHLDDVASWRVNAAAAETYPVTVDQFSWQESEGKPRYVLTGAETVEALEWWTAGELLEVVQEEFGTRVGLWYNTVCYRASGEAPDPVGEPVEEGALMVGIATSGAVRDEVPDGRVVRVTSGQYAPYEWGKMLE